MGKVDTIEVVSSRADARQAEVGEDCWAFSMELQASIESMGDRVASLESIGDGLHKSVKETLGRMEESLNQKLFSLETRANVDQVMVDEEVGTETEGGCAGGGKYQQGKAKIWDPVKPSRWFWEGLEGFG